LQILGGIPHDRKLNVKFFPRKSSVSYLYSKIFSSGGCRFTAAIAEMLFQSDGHDLYVLPALPARQWRDGFITGLRGRGAITVGIRWIGGNLEEVDIQVSESLQL
jgi:alpha-L-fucosidase 2